ncbi:MAG: hypothetical protein DMD36_10610 [Gemmatimonadetes bacterium]|nr:MAG: hypothetical protein DMD36_10610 [Gemmatimonadota bacterium]
MRLCMPSLSVPSACTPNGFAPNTSAWRWSLKVSIRICTLSSVAILSRSASDACTAPCVSNARTPK